MIETQFQTKISILHSDNDDAYFNEYLIDFCKFEDFHPFTRQVTPQQIGITE